MKSQSINVDVVGTGLVSLDHLFIDTMSLRQKAPEGMPRLGANSQKTPQEAVTPICESERFEYLGSYGGGSVCNTMCYLSTLGFSCSIIGTVGADEQGRIVRSDLDDFGISHDYLIQKKDISTRQYAHLIYLGKSTDHVYLQKCQSCGRRFNESGRLKPWDLTEGMYDLISRTKILHVDRPSEANVRLVDFAFKANKIISFDFGYYAPFYRLEDVLNIAKKATILKTSSHAASLFLKTNQFKSFRDVAPNARLYVNTLGGKGIEGYALEKSSVLPFSKGALPCPRFLESGGAGDAFHAGLLYKVLEGGMDAVVGSLQETLDFSQGLASLCCMFLGARGYLISKLKNSTLLDIRASIISDVEYLIQGNADHITASSSGIPQPRMPWAYDKADFCLACGRAIRPLTSCYYELSLDAIPTFMARAFRRFLSQEQLDITPEDRVYIVGSGGSFSASVFFQLMLNDYVDASAFAMTPCDFLEFGKPNSKIVLVSYGGNNPDIISTYNRIIDMGAQRVYAITASQTSKLSRLVGSQKHGSVYCVTDGYVDTGFVSTIGMLSTMAAMCSLVSACRSDVSLPVFFGEPSLKDFFVSAKAEVEQKFNAMSARFSDLSHRHIVALGSGWAWPALVDFESKITEGGVSTIEISETKNYTHGRYINAYRNKGSRMFVLLSTPHNRKLVDFLDSRFSKDFPTVVLDTKESGLKASVELTVKQLYLTNAIAKSQNIDIARPYFPQEARGLYSWGPIYGNYESGKKSNV